MDLYGEPFVAVAVSGLSFDHKPTSWEYMMRHKSFENKLLTPGDLLLSISCGFSYGAWTLAGEGNAISFLKSSVISLDLEGGPEAAQRIATDNDFYRRYGLACYTTLSHTEDNPRCRLVFVLESPITNEREYKDTAQAISSMWPSSVVDKGTVDPVRRFLGNPNTNMIVNGEMLDTDIAQGMADAWRIQQARLRTPVAPRSSMTVSTKDAPGNPPAFLLTMLSELSVMGEGGRNNHLNKTAFCFGKFAVGPGYMPRNVAVEFLTHAAQSCGLLEEEPSKTRIAIENSLTKGATQPVTYEQRVARMKTSRAR